MIKKKEDARKRPFNNAAQNLAVAILEQAREDYYKCPNRGAARGRDARSFFFEKGRLESFLHRWGFEKPFGTADTIRGMLTGDFKYPKVKVKKPEALADPKFLAQLRMKRLGRIDNFGRCYRFDI